MLIELLYYGATSWHFTFQNDFMENSFLNLFESFFIFFSLGFLSFFIRWASQFREAIRGEGIAELGSCHGGEGAAGGELAGEEV